MTERGKMPDVGVLFSTRFKQQHLFRFSGTAGMNADNYTNKDSAEKKCSVKTLVTRAT